MDINLAQFKYWMEQKDIEHLTPDPLFEEWFNKHREVTRGKAKGARHTNAGMNASSKEDAEQFNDGAESAAEDSYQYFVDSQITIIDALLNSSPVVRNFGNVLERITELEKSKASPFYHRNREKSNKNDALIIFLALEYCKQANISEFVFLSGNTEEFASQDDKSKIHPNIAKEYPDINIHYFKEAKDAVEFLQKKGLKLVDQFKRRPKKVAKFINIDEDIHLVDQLHQYFEARFDQWNYLPKAYWTKHYPFVVGPHEISYNQPFTLGTDNPQLYALLKGLVPSPLGYNSAISLDGVQDAQTKIYVLLKQLANNGAFFVSFGDEDNIRLQLRQDNNSCLCHDCRWRRFDISVMLSQIDFKSDDLAMMMDLGYSAYKLGHYKKSLELFVHCRRLAMKKKKYLIQFIAELNLTTLVRVVSLSNSEQDRDNMLKVVPNFDIETTIPMLPNHDQALAQKLFNDQFLDVAALVVEREAGRLRRYHRGDGFPSTNSIQYLVEAVRDTREFFVKNCIVYDDYMPFRSLFEPFFEALIASFTTKGVATMRIANLSDVDLEMVIEMGNRRTIRSVLEHYEVNKLPYQRFYKMGFANRFQRLVDELISSKNSSSQPWPTKLIRKTHVYFENMLMLACYLELNPMEVESMSKDILRFLNQLDDSRLLTTLRQDLLQFVGHNALNMPEDLHLAFYKLGIRNQRLRDEGFLQSLCSTYKVLGIQCFFPTDIIEEAFNALEASTATEWNDGIEGLICILKGQPETMERLHTCVLRRLKVSFSADFYYDVSMYVDNLPKEYEDEYVKRTGAYIQSLPAPVMEFGDGTDFDPRIDRFLNFIFMKQGVISDAVKSAIVRRGIYYDWLLNLDSFDYTHFKVSWIDHHFTVYYKRYFRTSKKLLDHFKEELKRFYSKEYSYAYCLLSI
ncbi:hypothetical protein [Chitinophaga rhizosphaerae]|uniref:hypothetical protein n=1 Tax=Chitinophaga rhizosphaerae TaxID=1864947 RepID=UPI000F811AEF|nr:hypothetical protein [Chitinophaga rhizosphaerae]